MRYVLGIVLITAIMGCGNRPSPYPPAETPKEALQAFIQAIRDDDQNAFYGYASPVEMTATSKQKMFDSLHAVSEFQTAFDQKFGADRWDEFMETKGHDGGSMFQPRIPSDFDWFEDNKVEISPSEVHVTVPGERDATVIRKLDDSSGWKVDLLKASFQHPDVNMDQTATMMSKMLGTIPEATQAIENGETDFAKLVDLCAKGLKSMFSLEVTPRD